jgi:hypothetical protein
MGDLNYRMVGLSGRQVLHLLKENRVREMHDQADGEEGGAAWRCCHWCWCWC